MIIRNYIFVKGFAWLCGVFVCTAWATEPQNKKFELSPGVSLNSPDTFRAGVLGSIQGDYRINRTWWVGASYFVGKAQLDAVESVQSVDDGDLWQGYEANVYVNMPGLLGLEDGNHIDLFTSLGVGHMTMGDHATFTGMIGGGMLIYFKPSWIALRFDLKNYFYKLNNAAGSNFNSDMTLILAPSFLF